MSSPPPMQQGPPGPRPGPPAGGPPPPGVRPPGAGLAPPPGAMMMGPNGQPMMRPPPPGAFPPGAGPPPGVRPPGVGPPPGAMMGPNGQPMMRGPPPPGAFPPGQGPPPGARPPGVGPPPGAFPPGQGPPPGARPPGSMPPPGAYPPGAGPPLGPNGQPMMRGPPPPGAFPPGQGPPPGTRPPGSMMPPQGAFPPGQAPPPGSLPPGQGPRPSPTPSPPPSQSPPLEAQQQPARPAQPQQPVAAAVAAAPVPVRPTAASAQQSAAFAAGAKQREKAAAEQNIKDIWTSLIEERASEAAAAAATAAAALAGEAGAVDKTREATIVYVGPRQSGKSTLINAYMYKDRDDVPKATTCLDYKYTRSSVKDAMAEEKSVSHFWELGGGRALVQLLDVAITADSMPHTLVVLTVDLARLSRVTDDAAFYLGLVRQRCDAVLAEMRSQGKSALAAQLVANARKRFGEQHADINRVELLPVPVLICANKFDTLKSTEPESLRILARTLRALAHSNGASLLYTSRAHRDTLLKNYRARLTAHVMASSSGGGKAAAPSLDHTQHISLHAGQDSFAQIGDAPGKDAQAKGPVAAWMAAFPKYFEGGPQDAEEGAVMEELTLEPERSVDAALALRQEDLRRLQRELALRRKLLAQEADGPTVMAANAARMR